MEVESWFLGELKGPRSTWTTFQRHISFEYFYPWHSNVTQPPGSFSVVTVKGDRVAGFENRWLLKCKSKVPLVCPITHTHTHPSNVSGPLEAKPGHQKNRLSGVPVCPVQGPGPYLMKTRQQWQRNSSLAVEREADCSQPLSWGSASQSPVVQGHLSVPGCDPLWVKLPCVCTQCFPQCLSCQKVQACAFWLVKDKPVDFKIDLIPGF